MTALVTCDLDRTLIYSRAAAGPDFEAVDPRCVEIHDGAPLSFMAAEAAAGLVALATRAAVVPTTTRTPEQYRRIELPGAPYRYAICSNGGELLVDGAADPRWREHVAELLAALPAGPAAIAAELAGRLDPAWEPRLREVEGLFCYVVSEARIPAAWVAAWRAHCHPLGWTVSQQGRKLYTTPDPLTKSHAAAEVRRRLIADGTLPAGAAWLAAGDGALDADLLLAADAALRPRHGELHELGFTAPNLTITDGAGIRAGIEILRRLSAGIGTAPPVMDTVESVPTADSNADVTGTRSPIRTSAQE